jgi:CheY-like chemotaxis protein
VAKILVADDNSNVQKTVALALAELGVEVFAVNNGEAAVRKLADFSPDLVLADIFMPVRNGYEVCEYIKKDSRFNHVPVVLLVGAFDPLDEREAQRVGADGILKKPFVPPDPLITMVKTLLERTLGERMVSVAVSKPAAETQLKSEKAAGMNAPAPVTQTFEEPPDHQPLPPLHSAAFDAGERPVAFGQLLETPARASSGSTAEVIEPIENEEVLTSQRDATLGDPIFWRNDEPEPEPDSPSEEDHAREMSVHDWNQGEDSISLQHDASVAQPIEPLELIREGQEELSQSVVASGSILLDAAAQAPLTVESARAEDLAANPIEWMATAPAQPALQGLVETPEPATNMETHAQIAEAIPEAPIAPVLTPDPAPMPVVSSAPAEENSSAQMPDPALPPSQTMEKLSEKTQDAMKTQPSIPAGRQSVEDTARSIPKHDWADLTAVLKPISASLPAQASSADSSAREHVSSTLPTPPSNLVTPQTVSSEAAHVDPSAPAQVSSSDQDAVEAVVQKVLDKMRPQIVEIITKEFLRPIVQALVHREFDKH